MTFCVECGREGPVVDGLCAEDFGERHPLLRLPEVLEISRCVTCGSVEGRAGWAETSVEEAVPALIEGSVEREARVEDVRWTYEHHWPDEHRVDVTARGRCRVGPWTLDTTLETTVRVRRTTCPTCSRRAGGFYVGTVQVRAEGRDVAEVEVREIERLVRPWTEKTTGPDFVSRIDPVHGGIDILVSTNGLAKRLAREIAAKFGGTVRSSATLHGRKAGADLYRTTHGVRLTGFAVGDVLSWRRSKYRVVRGGDPVHLEEVGTKERVRARVRDLRNARVVRKAD